MFLFFLPIDTEDIVFNIGSILISKLSSNRKDCFQSFAVQTNGLTNTGMPTSFGTCACIE